MKNTSEEDRKRGNFIVKRREEIGMTQEQLAENVGVSRRIVSAWENGKKGPWKHLTELSRALAVEESEIILGEEKTLLDVAQLGHTLLEKMVIVERSKRIIVASEIILIGLGAILIVFSEQLRPVLLCGLGVINIIIGTVAHYITTTIDKHTSKQNR